MAGEEAVDTRRGSSFGSLLKAYLWERSHKGESEV